MRKLLSVFLSTVCAVGMCLSFSACNKEDNESQESQEKYQVSQEEYEAAFSLDSFKNVTMSIVSQMNNKDIQSYFYNDGDNYALCRYDGDMQYYGRYYGVENGEEFCYLYGNEQLENFTQEQAVWTKRDNPSYYATKGINEIFSYQREYSLLEYDKETKTYVYENTAYGTTFRYFFSFQDKKLIKYEIFEWDEKVFSMCLYDYETTEIPQEIVAIKDRK